MNDEDLTYAWIRSSAAMMNLPLDPAWMPAVKANVDVTFRLAALVDEFALPDEIEPAPVYET
jgi:Protein of unknown function (DUF4089)